MQLPLLQDFAVVTHHLRFQKCTTLQKGSEPNSPAPKILRVTWPSGAHIDTKKHVSVCVCLKCPADEEPLVPKTLPLGRGRLTGRAWLTVQLDLHCLAFKLQKLLSLQVRNVQVGTGFDAPNQMSTDIRPDTKDSCFPQGTSLHGLGQLPCLHGQLPRQVATGQLNKMQSAHLADPARTYIRARAARAARAATASVMLTPWIICQGTAPLSRARSVRSRRGGWRTQRDPSSPERHANNE